MRGDEPVRELAHYAILDSLLEGCQVIAFDWRYLYVNHAAEVHARKGQDELVGRTMMEVYPGIERSPTFDLIRECMDTREAKHLENEFTYPDGSRAWFELRLDPVPEGVFVLSLDITSRKDAERAVRQQLEQLRSLRAIDVAILGSTNFRLVLETVLAESVKRLHVDAAAVFLLDAGRTALDAVLSLGFRTDEVDTLRVRVGDGAVGRAALGLRTELIPDVADAAAARDDVPPGLLADGTRGFCAVPLVAKSHLIGVLAVAHRAPLDVDDDWVGFLDAVAGQAAMAIEAGKSYESLQKAHLELALAYETTIEGWSNALELRDQQTAHHTARVTELTVELARAAGLGDAEIVHIRRGALLHDIGKMAVPDEILLKRGKLTAEETAVMQRHPTYAHDLLWPIAYLRPALDIPYRHHERWDGNGYPRGLKGEAIPLAARLFAVVDVWDALRSARPYREGWNDERAREHLLALAGSHLDPAAVGLFTKLLDARGKRGDADPHG